MKFIFTQEAKCLQNYLNLKNHKNTHTGADNWDAILK